MFQPSRQPIAPEPQSLETATLKLKEKLLNHIEKKLDNSIHNAAVDECVKKIDSFIKDYTSASTLSDQEKFALSELRLAKRALEAVKK